MKIITTNRRARHDYEIIKKYEAGLVLLGWEIKSIRAHDVNIKSAFVFAKNEELFLKNSQINLYMGVKGDEFRDRKLLMHRQEIRRIIHTKEAEKLQLIPLNLHFTPKSKVKLEFALAKSKRQYEKRQDIKDREVKRRLQEKIKKGRV